VNLKVLSIATGILLVLAVAGVVIDRNWDDARDGARVGKVLLEDIDMTQAGSIEILSEEGTIDLKVENGAWVVEQQDGFPAGLSKIQSFLFRLSRARIEHKVTENPERLAELGLLTLEENGDKFEKDKTATVFTINDAEGKRLYRLYIGADRRSKSGQSLRAPIGGQYVRFPDEAAAYLIANPLFLEREAQDWLRAEIFDFDHEKQLRRVRLRQPGKKELVLSRDDPEKPWRVSGIDEAKLDMEEVKDLARRVAELEVSRVAARGRGEKELGRSELAVIDLDLFDKRSYRVEIGLESADEDFRYVKFSATVDASVEDESLKKSVAEFNDVFAKRRIAVYEWEAEQVVKAGKDLLKLDKK